MRHALRVLGLLTLFGIGTGFTSEYESDVEFSSPLVPTHLEVQNQIKRKLQRTSLTWWVTRPQIEILEVQAHPTMSQRYRAHFRTLN